MVDLRDPARPSLDLTLYLITDTRLCGDHGVVPTVVQAVEAGATLIQLRDPGCSDDDFVRLGIELRSALAGCVPLIVNDRVHLVEAIGAAGAHVGQGDLDPVAARNQLGPAAWLGLSVQTLEHVSTAKELPSGTIDYLGIGPVWSQATKPDAASPSGPAILTQIVRESSWPCVAIGGIDETRMAEVRRSGAAGVAVVSAICGQPDVATATRNLRKAWNNPA